jgi:carbohydrate kinase (thermoresistant glucokinase family)
VVLVVMGVSGSGKTTVARLLARRLGWPLAEGDAFHPESNIEKMKSGRALTDADRRSWLARVADWIEGRLDSNQDGVITCSALKRAYRDVIDRRGSGVVFVFLSGRRDVMGARVAARRGHFMPPSLVDSQFADLEEPSPDEPAIRVDAGRAPAVIARSVLDELGLLPSTRRRRTPRSP